MRYILGLFFMIWSIFSSAEDYPIVEVTKEDGFVDLSFQVEKSSKLANGSFEITVKGIFNGHKTGFSLELLPSWSTQTVEGMDQPFYWGEAFFKSTGIETKEFIIALAKSYELNVPEFSVPEKVPAQIVGLACNPQDLENSSCKMKLFFNSDESETLYSEVFINVDLQAGILEFNEKDIDYRVPLMLSLSQ